MYNFEKKYITEKYNLNPILKKDLSFLKKLLESGDYFSKHFYALRISQKKVHIYEKKTHYLVAYHNYNGAYNKCMNFTKKGEKLLNEKDIKNLENIEKFILAEIKAFGWYKILKWRNFNYDVKIPKSDYVLKKLRENNNE